MKEHKEYLESKQNPKRPMKDPYGKVKSRSGLTKKDGKMGKYQKFGDGYSTHYVWVWVDEAHYRAPQLTCNQYGCQK